jgi:hypothetical protein
MQKQKPAAMKEFAELTAFAKKLDELNDYKNGMVHITRKD